MILPPFAKSAQLSLSFANKFIQAMLSHISHTTSWCGSAASTVVRPGAEAVSRVVSHFFVSSDKKNKLNAT